MVPRFRTVIVTMPGLRIRARAGASEKSASETARRALPAAVAGASLVEVEPALNRLITGLQTLAQNYPDLTPILEKYGIKSPAADQSSQPAAAPSTPPAKPGK